MKRRLAILAQFPVHLLPGFAHLGEPKQHYATWLPQLAESFARSSGFEFHWVVLTTEVQQPLKVEGWNQTFHLLPTANRRRASTFFRQDRLAINAVLAEVNPALVHGWGTEDVYAFAAVLSGRPNIVSMAGLLSYYVLKTKMHPRDYFQSALELFILKKAGHITVETEWGRKVLAKRTGRPISLVEYGVNPHFLDVPWNPDPSQPRALFVGSIVPRKGIQDLVTAFASPALANFELRVAGAGGGAWADELRARATPNVRWLGQTPSESTAKELSQSWCLVLPTRCDTSPNVVKEARVIGLPVVTTPEGGQSDYIIDQANGFIVNPGDTDKLTTRLGEMLGGLSKCRTMGASHLQEAREHFRPSRTAELLIALYSQMV